MYELAKADPQHRWHAAAQGGAARNYMARELTLVSRDGLHWEMRPDLNWGLPDWHPEPPIFGFYNRQHQRHMMTVRPGWGDRRVAVQSTQDFLHWSGPELLLQPDVLDGELSLNVEAPWGELRCQLTDLKSEPIEGFTFDDCLPLVREDSLETPLRWRDKTADSLVGQPLRLQLKWRDARLFALRGRYHFLDAQDLHLLQDGQPIDPTRFSF